MPSQTLSLAVVAAALSQDPRAVPVRSRAAGFSGLQFDAYSAALDVPELSVSGRREFLRLLGTQDQQLVGLRWDAGSKGLRPGADVDQALARLERVMESAAGLQAPLVCVDVGPLPEPPPEAKPKPKVTQDQAGLILLPTSFEKEQSEAADRADHAEAAKPRPADLAFASQVDGALAELGQRADRYGVTVAFRSELSSFAAVDRALRQARCPWFGVDLDPVAVLRDAWDVDEVFSQLGELIRHVLGRDATRGADRRTKPAVVGHGNTEWEKLLANLDAAGYSGWITVDPIELTDRAGAAVQAHTYLKKLISR
jgi:sugar phosphate isomerase/epimerase